MFSGSSTQQSMNDYIGKLYTRLQQVESGIFYQVNGCVMHVLGSNHSDFMKPEIKTLEKGGVDWKMENAKWGPLAKLSKPKDLRVHHFQTHPKWLQHVFLDVCWLGGTPCVSWKKQGIFWRNHVWISIVVNNLYVDIGKYFFLQINIWIVFSLHFEFRLLTF